MASEAMLRGRYYSQMRKLGAAGLAVSAVSGVITYFAVYKQRTAAISKYMSNVTDESQRALERRIHKYSGMKLNEEYPGIPMYKFDNEEANEGFQKVMESFKSYADNWVKISYIIQKFDPSVTQDDIITSMIAAVPTKVDPFNTPALKQKRDRAVAKVQAAMNKTTKELGIPDVQTAQGLSKEQFIQRNVKVLKNVERVFKEKGY